MLELNAANEATRSGDKSRALLAKQVIELQGALEAAEEAGGKSLKNAIKKLEQRVSVHLNSLDLEVLHYQQSKKSVMIKQKRRSKHVLKPPKILHFINALL